MWQLIVVVFVVLVVVMVVVVVIVVVVVVVLVIVAVVVLAVVVIVIMAVVLVVAVVFFGGLRNHDLGLYLYQCRVHEIIIWPNPFGRAAPRLELVCCPLQSQYHHNIRLYHHDVASMSSL